MKTDMPGGNINRRGSADDLRTVSTEAAETPARPGVRAPAAKADASAVYLDLVWDPEKPVEPGYSLTVNGGKIGWGSPGSAACSCAENGLRMTNDHSGRIGAPHSAPDQKIIFCDSITVNGCLYLRGSVSGALSVINIDLVNGGDPDTIRQTAADTYRKLSDRLGDPSYSDKGGKETDRNGDDDFTGALDEVMRSDRSMRVSFKSLSLSVSKDRVFIGLYSWD